MKSDSTYLNLNPFSLIFLLKHNINLQDSFTNLKLNNILDCSFYPVFRFYINQLFQIHLLIQFIHFNLGKIKIRKLIQKNILSIQYGLNHLHIQLKMNDNTKIFKRFI